MNKASRKSGFIFLCCVL